MLATAALATIAALTMARPAPIAPNNGQAFGMQAPRGTKVDVYNTKNARGRVFLLHGLGGSRQAMRQDAFKRMIDHLRGQGYQVIVPSLPYDSTNPQLTQAQKLQQVLPAQQGAAYKHTWDRRFNDLVRWADNRYGRAQTTVGGFSWGGFNTLLAAAANPRVSRYFANMPVVDPTKLNEFSNIQLGNLQAAQLARQLRGKQGFIGYGGRDTRVGGTAPVEQLLANLKAQHAPVTSMEYPTLGHTTNIETVDNILRWNRRQQMVNRFQQRQRR